MDQRALTFVARFTSLLLLCAVTTTAAPAADPPADVAPLLAQTASDGGLANYPHFREHVVHILQKGSPQGGSVRLNPYVRDMLKAGSRPAVALTREDVFGFFDAAAKDRLTILRAMALVARAVRRTGVVAYLNGRDARDAVEQLDLDVGLAVPMRHLLLFAYVPSDGPASSDVQCRFVAVYGAAYEHRFPKEVLDATLKIGTGRTAPYFSPWDPDAAIRTGYLVEGNLVYGDARVGYVDIRGIGGRKHGLLGTVQRVLFFLPDGISGMVVRGDDLHVDAILDQRVSNFEKNRTYSVHPRRRTDAYPPSVPGRVSGEPRQ